MVRNLFLENSRTAGPAEARELMCKKAGLRLPSNTDENKATPGTGCTECGFDNCRMWTSQCCGAAATTAPPPPTRTLYNPSKTTIHLPVVYSSIHWFLSHYSIRSQIEWWFRSTCCELRFDECVTKVVHSLTPSSPPPLPIYVLQHSPLTQFTAALPHLLFVTGDVTPSLRPSTLSMSLGVPICSNVTPSLCSLSPSAGPGRLRAREHESTRAREKLHAARRYITPPSVPKVVFTPFRSLRGAGAARQGPISIQRYFPPQRRHALSGGHGARIGEVRSAGVEATNWRTAPAS